MFSVKPITNKNGIEDVNIRSSQKQLNLLAPTGNDIRLQLNIDFATHK